MPNRACVGTLSLLGIGVCLLIACDTRITAPSRSTDSRAVVAIAISGLPPQLSVGQKVQLTAFVVRADGSREETTGQVVWRSSNVSVATVSEAGLLTITGSGEADVSAALASVSGVLRVSVSRPIATYALSGVVHEGAPTDGVLVPGARIEVVGHTPIAGQVFTTDPAGRFSLPPVADPGFALKFKKPGYEDLHVDIVNLPRDQTLDVGLLPEPATVQEVMEGTLPAECVGIGRSTRVDRTFAVHRAGQVLFTEFLRPRTHADGGPGVALYQGDRLIFATNCPTCPLYRGSWPLLAGFFYRVSLRAEFCTTDPADRVYRLVFSHPS